MTQMPLHKFINIDTVPHGALFISITPKTNAVYAYFGETWIIGDYVYCDSDITPAYLGESLMPVDELTVIALPLRLTDITDDIAPAWANYVTVSGSGIVRFWEYKPSPASNSDDFDCSLYDFHVMRTTGVITKLPYFYAVCYNLKGDLC